MSWKLPLSCIALSLALFLTSGCATDDGTFLDALRAHAAGETPQPTASTPQATSPPVQSELPGTPTSAQPTQGQTTLVPSEATPTGPTGSQPTQGIPTTVIPTDSGPPAETTPAEETTTPVDAPVEVVSIDGLAFVPNDLTVAPNTLVRWQNQSGFAHTVVSGEPGAQTELFEIEVLDAGGQGEFLFTEAGEFPYFSIDFQSMTGIVRVE